MATVQKIQKLPVPVLGMQIGLGLNVADSKDLKICFLFHVFFSVFLGLVGGASSETCNGNQDDEAKS